MSVFEGRGTSTTKTDDTVMIYKPEPQNRQAKGIYIRTVYLVYFVYLVL